MTRGGRPRQRFETLVSASILVALVAIAAAVLLKQSRYDPAQFALAARLAERTPIAAPSPSAGAGWAAETRSAEPDAGGKAEGEAGASAPPPAPAQCPAPHAGAFPDLGTLAPEGIEPQAAAETFDPENLSEKIDGRAELYLAAGFASLRCQRFGRPGDAGSLFEVFIYDMGAHRRAFAVFAAQRRRGAARLALTEHGCATENALFFVHGPYYVEIISGASGDAARAAPLAYAQELVRAIAVPDERIGELALFPEDGLEPDSFGLLLSSAFGFDGLEDVFTARYGVEGERVTAFLSVRRSEAEAAEKAARYRDFLIENGGAGEGEPPGAPGVSLVRTLGAYEAIFARGNFLGGVHGARTRGAAERVAADLQRALRRSGR